MLEKVSTVTEIAEALSTGHAPDQSLRLEFGECTIEVKSDSKALIDRLKEYYKEFLGKKLPDIQVLAFEIAEPKFDFIFMKKPPEPGKSKIKEEFFDLRDGRVVRKILTGMYFIFGRGINIAAGNCLQNYNQVVNFINNRYIERMIKRECMLMHAAGVVLKGKGIAIAGFAGRGKSTLALTLLNRGLKFLSNDRVMVKKYDGGTRMYGIPKLPRVNPGTILSNPVLGKILTEEERHEFEKYTPEKLWELEHKFDVDISEIYGSDRFSLQAEMKALVIINWDRNGDEPFAITEVDLVGRPDLVHAYMKLPGLFFEMSEDTKPPDFSEAAYINCMKSCRVFEITGSVNFEEAAEHCISLLEDVKTAGITGLNASK